MRNPGFEKFDNNRVALLVVAILLSGVASGSIIHSQTERPKIIATQEKTSQPKDVTVIKYDQLKPSDKQIVRKIRNSNKERYLISGPEKDSIFRGVGNSYERVTIVKDSELITISLEKKKSGIVVGVFLDLFLFLILSFYTSETERVGALLTSILLLLVIYSPYII